MLCIIIKITRSCGFTVLGWGLTSNENLVFVVVAFTRCKKYSDLLIIVTSVFFLENVVGMG